MMGWTSTPFHVQLPPLTLRFTTSGRMAKLVASTADTHEREQVCEMVLQVFGESFIGLMRFDRSQHSCMASVNRPLWMPPERSIEERQSRSRQTKETTDRFQRCSWRVC